MLRKAVLGVALLITTWSSCAATVEPVHTEHVENGLRIRESEAAGIHFLEVLPAEATENARLPLVVWLHGRGDRPRAPDGAFLGLRDMRLIVPQAPEPYRRGYSWLPVSAARGESPELVQGLRTRSAQLARMIGELEERYPTRGAPIVMGFSQGGMLTMTLAVRHPAVVGDAFPVAGWLPPSLVPDRPPNAMHPSIHGMHGIDDGILPVERTERAAQALERRGYDVELRTFDGVGHETSPDMWRQLRKWLRKALEERQSSGQPAGLA